MIVNLTECVFRNPIPQVHVEGTESLTEKVKAILEYPKPGTMRQLRSFLGELLLKIHSQGRETANSTEPIIERLEVKK